MKAIIIIIPYLVLIGYNLGNVMCNHIPSEDRNESDGVELIREKRGDSFLDRIMKSIPFLHMSSPPNILEEEPIDRIDDDDNDDGDDDDDDDEDKSMTSENVPTFLPTVGLSDVPTSVLTKASTTMSSTATILSATSVQTATLFSSNSSTHIVSISESIDSISTTVSIVSTTSTSEMIKTTPAQTSIIIVTPSVADIKSLAPDSFMNSPFTSSAASNAMLNVTSLFTYPLSASHVSPMQISSSGILPSGVPKMAATPLVEKVDEEPVIKMMIMSGESPMLVHEYGGRLADERGFGDELVKEQIGDEEEVKNIRFMYAGILVPVMSGLAGALMITFAVLTYKCLKRKKLKRIRYYGAKPSSGLYRLDQIGLLSDTSSDEE